MNADNGYLPAFDSMPPLPPHPSARSRNRPNESVSGIHPTPLNPPMPNPIIPAPGNDDGRSKIFAAQPIQVPPPIPSFAARPAPGRIWLVGAHGGSGCSTIRMSAKDRYVDAGRALPVSTDPRVPSRIVLCAMCTGRGLESLRNLLANWNDGLFGASVLMGVAVTMPSPRTPRELRRGTLLVGSAAPALWRLPFIRNLDLDGFPEAYPHAYERMLKDLNGSMQTADGISGNG
ncbi:hypothetical protein LMG10733_1330 [Bifidobacterium adolescentis]|uniref:hypothetical protein n=2 Tax=Bifidobacterium adolescentis TaxID=1680 RepID=UPI000A215B99|nr:hypothetical protein [Bifidobacterium adolescentis]OSG97442.1 hypothetical protein LMG10733_1330 [Bifidobacterium adolescentis]SPU23428.1 Uncharacterised protein [Bifidobacterium adolescentis]